MGDFGKGLKNFKDQVKSNKDVEEEVVEALPEKSKSTKKKVVKKKTVKKKT